MFGRTISVRFAKFITSDTLTRHNSTITLENALLNKERSSSDDSEWNRALPYEEMPSMGSLPIIGNKWRALPVIGQLDLKRMHVSMKRIYDEFGACVKVPDFFGNSDMIFLFDPNDIERIMRTDTNRSYFETSNYYKYVMRKDFFGENKGVIDVKHADWLKFRPKVQKDMLDPKVIKLYTNQLENVASALVHKIKRERDDFDEMENFSNDLRAWALESIGTIALDTRLGCLEPVIEPHAVKLLAALKVFVESAISLEFELSFWKIIETPTWKNYVKSLDTFSEVIAMYTDKVMQQKIDEKNEDSLSLLQRLIIRNKNDPSVAISLAFDMFLVGIDTTSYSIGTLLYQLTQNQQVQEILYKEILSVLPNEKDVIDLNVLQRMPYLKACIKENLRVNPVLIGNVRHLTENHVIHGYQVHKGTQVCFAHHTLTNSDEYFKHSEKFIPERWLQDNFDINRNKFAYLPFSFGKRMCLGKRIADLESQILICMLLRNFKLEYRHTKLEFVTRPLLQVDEPFKLAFVDRKH